MQQRWMTLISCGVTLSLICEDVSVTFTCEKSPGLLLVLRHVYVAFHFDVFVAQKLCDVGSKVIEKRILTKQIA